MALPGVALTAPLAFGTSYGAWTLYADGLLYTYPDPYRLDATGCIEPNPALHTSLINPNGLLPESPSSSSSAASSGSAVASSRSGSGACAGWTRVLPRNKSERICASARAGTGASPPPQRYPLGGVVVRVDCDLTLNTVSFALTHWYDREAGEPLTALPPFVPLSVAYHIPELADCVPYIGVADESYAILPVDTPDHELLNPALHHVLPAADSTQTA